LERQEKVQRREALQRQKELQRLEKLRRKEELKRQKELQRQEELEPQEELQRKAEIEYEESERRAFDEFLKQERQRMHLPPTKEESSEFRVHLEAWNKQRPKRPAKAAVVPLRSRQAPADHDKGLRANQVQRVG
jgi:hypothetical protein